MMDAKTRIERALTEALDQGQVSECPPRLAEAVRYAVFPGGARLRPMLSLAVSGACGEDDSALADAAAAAIELMHCASLVHDDLPCFDDAAMRRGKPTIHKAYDERIAVLTGDALMVLAFQTLARHAVSNPARLGPLTLAVGRGVGVPKGIIPGQAWECEPGVTLSEYQREKTGALFAAATEAGAAAAGVEAGPWRLLGERLGEAYQVADDIRDVIANEDELGKPTGQDEALDRPSAVRELGLSGAKQRLETLIESALASIPDCPGASELKSYLMNQSRRFFPGELGKHAA